MLVDGFYTIIDKKIGDNLFVNIRLNPKHKIFKGHFPQQPLVPGVMQLQIAREILEEHLGNKLFMNNISQVKYLIPIIPDEKLVSFNISFSRQEKQIKANILIGFEDKIFTKAKINYTLQ